MILCFEVLDQTGLDCSGENSFVAGTYDFCRTSRQCLKFPFLFRVILIEQTPGSDDRIFFGNGPLSDYTAAGNPIIFPDDDFSRLVFYIPDSIFTVKCKLESMKHELYATPV